jgi:hypothetical protein
VHTPTPDEIANPYLFAANVQRMMARALNVPATTLAVDDVAYVTYDGDWRRPQPGTLDRLVQMLQFAYVLATF